MASKGVRQVAKITSGERSNTMTVVCAMSAVGAGMLPMFLFPRKRMVEVLMNGAPSQYLGQTNPISDGCEDVCDVAQPLREVHEFVTDKPSHIIVMDGHHSHKTLAAVEYARSNWIDMVTLPPRCTHKVQPLDRNFFKSFKRA